MKLEKRTEKIFLISDLPRSTIVYITIENTFVVGNSPKPKIVQRNDGENFVVNDLH